MLDGPSHPPATRGNQQPPSDANDPPVRRRLFAMPSANPNPARVAARALRGRRGGDGRRLHIPIAGVLDRNARVTTFDPPGWGSCFVVRRSTSSHLFESRGARAIASGLSSTNSAGLIANVRIGQRLASRHIGGYHHHERPLPKIEGGEVAVVRSLTFAIGQRCSSTIVLKRWPERPRDSKRWELVERSNDEA